MTFSRKALVAAVLTLSVLTLTDNAEACKRGGYSRGYSTFGYGGYRRSYRRSYVGGYVGGYVRSQPPIQTAPPQSVAPQPPPQQFVPQQPAPQQPTLQQTTPAQPNNAQNSALQALGGFAPPEQEPAEAPAPALAGSWTASLGNGAKVQLTLQADGTFSWTATNAQGQPSSFSGRYTLGTGSLTLIRGNDNQQLAGLVTNSTGNAFSFKVAGNNTASINFSRS